MNLEYSNIFDDASFLTNEVHTNKKCSELMIEINGLLDFHHTTIKNSVNVLGVTASQVRKLASGDIHSFSLFELQTFIIRLNSTKLL